MSFFKKLLVYMLISLTFFISIIGLASGTIFNMNVQPNSQENHEFNLALEDRVLIQIRSIGITTGNFSASLIFPDGSKINFGEKNNIDYTFICEVEGKYSLELINSDMENERLVTLNIEIQSYIFGLPKMVVLTLLILGICLVGVVFFVFLGKTY